MESAEARSIEFRLRCREFIELAAAKTDLEVRMCSARNACVSQLIGTTTRNLSASAVSFRRHV
jgi:hypothetical protein